jgi:hypothetical protein
MIKIDRMSKPHYEGAFKKRQTAASELAAVGP